MKVGDKVILRKYESCDSLDWWGGDNWVDKETIVERVDDSDGTFMFADGCWWVQSACEIISEPCSEPAKKERYFLFSYASEGNMGNTWLKSDKMPTNNYLSDFISGKLGTKTAAVIGIFEFQSEQDYLDFTGDE